MVPPPFGEFYGAYGGILPSHKALRRLYTSCAERRREYLDKRMCMLDPTDIMKGDASRKIVRGIRIEGSQVFQGCFTVMNK